MGASSSCCLIFAVHRLGVCQQTAAEMTAGGVYLGVALLKLLLQSLQPVCHLHVFNLLQGTALALFAALCRLSVCPQMAGMFSSCPV